MYFQDFLTVVGRHLCEQGLRDYDITALEQAGDDDCLIEFESAGQKFRTKGHREYRMFRGKMRPDITFTEPEQIEEVIKPMRVHTPMGDICVEADENDVYPGVWIDFIPEGRKAVDSITIARVEVSEENLALHTYVTNFPDTRDVNGTLVPGKVSLDGPIESVRLSAEDIQQSIEEYEE